MSTKDTRRERRGSVAVRHSRERATQSTMPFRFFATKATKRERDIHTNESLRTRLSFSSDFASPPKSFSPIDEIRTRERKKERKNDEVYSSLLLSSSSNSSSLHIVLMNYAYICRLRECIARAVLSVSRSYSSRDAERQEFKFHFTTTKKKKVKRNERGALKESKKEHT